MKKWYRVFASRAEAEDRIAENTMVSLNAEGRKICLARTKSGFFAVDDACPHMGDRLSNGTVNYLNEVICPWHTYRYHLQSGEECRQRSAPVAVHEIEEREDGLYLGVEG